MALGSLAPRPVFGIDARREGIYTLRHTERGANLTGGGGKCAEAASTMMAFRQDGKQSHAWQQWCQQHRDALIRAGVPDSVLQSEFYWLKFLEEGYDLRTGWSPAQLSPEQARVLHAFILQKYGNDTYRACLKDIEQVFEKKTD